MREVEFHEPVLLGDIVSFFTDTVRIGRTSITVRVTVVAERWGAGRGDPVKVTEAEVVAGRGRRERPADPDQGLSPVTTTETVSLWSPSCVSYHGGSMSTAVAPGAGHSRSSARTTARTPA